eukprot:EG_transcript_61477
MSSTLTKTKRPCFLHFLFFRKTYMTCIRGGIRFDQFSHTHTHNTTIAQHNCCSSLPELLWGGADEAANPPRPVPTLPGEGKPQPLPTAVVACPDPLSTRPVAP